MAHPEQRAFFERVKEMFPEHFCDVRVLDIGSLDVNGNLRGCFDAPFWYVGLDLGYGKNVDVVCPGHLFDCGFKFDTVVSAECLEHDVFWDRTILNMVRLTRSGGLVAISCATDGRKEHGTMNCEPMSAPLLRLISNKWANYYRNLTEADFRNVLDVESLFCGFAFEVNEQTHDLYFWGILR